MEMSCLNVTSVMTKIECHKCHDEANVQCIMSVMEVMISDSMPVLWFCCMPGQDLRRI